MGSPDPEDGNHVWDTVQLAGPMDRTENQIQTLAGTIGEVAAAQTAESTFCGNAKAQLAQRESASSSHSDGAACVRLASEQVMLSRKFGRISF